MTSVRGAPAVISSALSTVVPDDLQVLQWSYVNLFHTRLTLLAN